MRTPALLLALSFSITAARADGYSPTDFSSYSTLPSRAKPWFQHLAAAQDTPNEVRSLAKVPQAEPAIVELMQKIINDPAGNPEHLRFVIQAIQVRRDLSAAHQTWLRELLLSRLSRTNGPMDEVLKTQGLLLLENPPSPENEAVLDQYLSDTSAPFRRNEENAVFYAMCALGRIGTLRSLRPLLKCAESHRSEPTDAGGDLYYRAMDVMTSIGRRAASTSPALQKLLDDCYPWCGVGMDIEVRARAEKALATRPEFKPQLLALLRVQYFEIIKWGGPGRATALSALSLRSDLTPAEQKFITTELETHVDPADESSFIGAAIRLLAHYPTPEHEALVVRFLNRDAEHDRILQPVFSTLSLIGGDKSLAAMREVRTGLKPKYLEPEFLQDLDQHIARMQDWLDRRTPPAQRRY